MTREDLLRKIRNLLAIAARSPYPAEAETAMATAQRLMLEHDISQVQVEASSRQYIDERFGVTFARRPAEDFVVASILEQFFFVRCGWGYEWDELTASARILRRVFGEEHHRAIAQFAWVYLARTFRACWNARVSQLTSRRAGKRSMFYRGLHDGLWRRLKAERQQQFSQAEGLIVASQAAINHAFAIAFPDAKAVGAREPNVEKIDLADLMAHRDGVARGSKIAIPAAIGSKATAPMLLEATR